ncbi:MAG TPA: sigma-70 family RNA polymerase sigma factor [Bacteroidales bacterium]|nr:sigma-70 family RNA polymerase sigma factor [Bacteroidales bacterium]HOK74829.1 sigma-70 family RNA polymerase sigma factor [Bacteroidales bacterium]HOU31668.1 sigma-70 family RNA polymerase sigma factor [Bacteroidales bacterium]HPP93677.1 sigma-70 family RNA polymerase sigma factor [Bacteroidales bacterium]HQG56778.1 sigma-70 family RNA polymerase sigma factor [Bacteroidales bacterium]
MEIDEVIRDTSELSEKARQDLILVEQAKNGDEKAFAALLNRYRDSIYYMLLKMVNNSSDAKDLTIEAFSKAFQSINTYTPDFAFSTWLFKIATNNCIDFLRKKHKTPQVLEQTDEDDDEGYEARIESDSPDPEEIMINNQDIDNLHKVVEQLKPKYRKLIELRYFREYSYEEISEELKIPIGTVKVQLFRAKAILYELLSRKGKK